MEKHRSVESCADCHSRIDPYGFPLEYFDPVGGYRPTYYRARFWHRKEKRTKYFPAQPIDGAAELPSGEKFHDPGSLKQSLLVKMDLVSKSLTGKLMTYATGRTMSLQDQEELEEIAKRAIEPGKGFRDLLKEVATSRAFTHR